MALPARLFCDSSFFFACLDTSDQNYQRAQELLIEATTPPSSFICTWDIISETVTLLRYRKGQKTAVRFLDEVKPHLQIFNYGQQVRTEAEAVFRRYGRDHRLSFCDAISFVVVTTLLGNMACLAFDRDFRGLGLTVIK